MLSDTEVKLGLKQPILNYDGKPIKDSSNFQKLMQENPGMPQDQVADKLPNVAFGKAFIQLLLQVPTTDNVEKLKIFRWASKIEDKLVTDKAELTLDINQITELFDFISKVQNAPIISIAPILITLEDLKNKLK